MVKKKVEAQPTVDSVAVLPAAPPAPAAPPPAPPSQERLSDQDVQTLEMAKLNRKVALKEAEKALAENNAAELSYKYLILQLYMKYGMSAVDALDEQGNIHRGVNVPQGQ